MKRIRNVTLVLVALVVPLGTALVIQVALAQRPKVTKQEDHYSPVLAEIVMPDGSRSEGMVVHCNYTGYVSDAHKYKGASEVATVEIWIDTIREIKDTTNQEATILLKDGTDRTLRYLGDSLLVFRPDGGTEIVSLAKVRKVRFLKPARKDKKGNAMFDHWLYSPFTGEQLPEN